MAQSTEILITASVLPKYAHPGDAGADLHSAEALILAPGARALVGTGVSVALPDGFAAFVVPRSGLAAKHGITIVNSPGTVDAGYRGEIKVALLNTDAQEPFSVAVGDRIAQLIIMPVVRATFIPVDKLPGSLRGEGGFGSTGLSSQESATTPTASEPAPTNQTGATR
ncbi:dUTP diphosphatase [Cryobacterium sp. MLB-32]|uniref:dUTP diphosphatase n=1 Tax=Cryobacterium sp. MLB-32 TaxID=1529318 RepID=UPI00068EFE77|nr:dUTP diphosphatase [Cryobacterium sp. MLB-32]